MSDRNVTIDMQRVMPKVRACCVALEGLSGNDLAAALAMQVWAIGGKDAAGLLSLVGEILPQMSSQFAKVMAGKNDV